MKSSVLALTMFLAVIGNHGCRGEKAPKGDDVPPNGASDSDNGASDSRPGDSAARDNGLLDEPLPGTPRPTPTIAIEPPDLTSDISESRIRLILTATAVGIGQNEIDDVSASVSILDERGSVLPFSTKVTSEEAGLSDPGASRTFIELIPMTQLPSGWNRVLLSKIPNGWQAMRFAWSPHLDAGRYVARLALGDAPVIRSVSTCPSDTHLDLTVEFSQNVFLGESDRASRDLVVRADNKDCAMRVPHDENVQSIDFACPTPSVSDMIQLDFSALSSRAGMAATLYDSPTDRAFDIGADAFEVSPQGPGCLVYRF